MENLNKMLIVENPTAFLMYRAVKAILSNDMDNDDLLASLADADPSDFERVYQVCSAAVHEDYSGRSIEDTALSLVSEHLARDDVVACINTSSELQDNIRELLRPRRERLGYLTTLVRLHRRVDELKIKLETIVEDFNDVLKDLKVCERQIEL